MYRISLEPVVPAPTFWGADKILHATEFFLLGSLLVRAAGPSGRSRIAWLVLGIGALAAAGDEWIQRSVPGRSSSVYDWLADLVGVGIAVLAAPRLWRRARPAWLAGSWWQPSE